MAVRQKMNKILPRAVQGLGTFLVCLALVLAVGQGVRPGGLLLFLCYALAGVWLPGRVLAGFTGARAAGLLQTASLVLGTGLFALTAALASATGLHGLVWALPALGLLGLAARRRDFQSPRAGAAPDAWGWNLAWQVLFFLCLFAGAARLARPLAVGSVLPDQDFFWNLGNVQAFLQGFPPADLRFAGHTLTYHWLTELLAAGFAMAGVPAYDALAFFLPPALLAAVLAAVRELGLIWFGGSAKKAAALAGLLLCTQSAGLWKSFGRRDPFWNLSLRHLATNVNGWATALWLLCAVLACAALLWRGTAGAWVYGCGFLAFGLLALAKGPVAGVAALALLCAGALRLFCQKCCRGNTEKKQNKADLHGFLFGFGCFLLFLLVYQALFAAGTGASVVFSPTGTLEKSWLGNFLLAAQGFVPRPVFLLLVPLFYLALLAAFAPAAAPLALAGAVRDAARLSRVPGPRLAATALALGGFLAFCLFDHEAMSQMYFAFAALPGLCLLAVENAGPAWAWARRGGLAKRLAAGLAAALAAAGLATGCFAWAGMTAEGVALLADRPAAVAGQDWDLPLTAGEEAAMEELAALLPADAWFATNRIHTGRALEGLSNVYTGLSGRTCWFEGFKYAMSNLGVGLPEVLGRLDAVQRAFSAPTAAQARDALPEEVRALVYSKAAAAAGQDVLEGAPAGEGFRQLPVLYENDDVVIYQLR